jgi:hypothetical protein
MSRLKIKEPDRKADAGAAEEGSLERDDRPVQSGQRISGWAAENQFPASTGPTHGGRWPACSSPSRAMFSWVRRRQVTVRASCAIWRETVGIGANR